MRILPFAILLAAPLLAADADLDAGVGSLPDERRVETITIELPGGVPLEMREVPGGPWFGTFEVTQAQWEAVLGNNPSSFKAPDNPVENVSWRMCRRYLQILNELPAVREAGFRFRFPTESEWELACRAGETDDILPENLDDVAWFAENAKGSTHRVGSKAPNALGFHDMLGNVSEWTDTGFAEVYPSAAQRLGLLHDYILRGGSWKEEAEDCMPDSRDRDAAGSKDNDTGLRLCSDPPRRPKETP